MNSIVLLETFCLIMFFLGIFFILLIFQLVYFGCYFFLWGVSDFILLVHFLKRERVWSWVSGEGRKCDQNILSKRGLFNKKK